jgi:hypothetical protein
MNDKEINELVSPFLRERFKDVGFQRATVRSEQDFDGSSILRVMAYFDRPDIPSERLINAVDDIRSKLLERGEERFVFLTSKYPQDEAVDEDVE